MTRWIELPEAEELHLPRSRLWMNEPSSYEERYTQPNDGYIEIDNPSDNEEKLEREKNYEEVITGMKERAKKSDVKKRSSKSCKSNTSQILNMKPLVLPSAPTNPVVPATLSQRKKGLHHPGGWHHRTRLESKAAEKLMSLFNSEIEDTRSIITNLVREASQTALRTIAEDDKDTIEQTVKAVKEKLERTSCSYQIVETSVDAPNNGMTINQPIELEKAQAEPDRMPTQVERRELEWFQAYFEKMLGQSRKRKRGLDNEGIEENGETDVDSF